MDLPAQVSVIDSHTAGEPTRVVVEGGPDLGTGSLIERRGFFRERHDAFRRAVILEPRGSDILVGAHLLPPADPSAVAGVIFFNHVGFLGMCGHGVMGVVVTLAELGRIRPGRHLLETPVGGVAFEWQGGASVTVENVPAHRLARAVQVEVDGLGKVTGDVAWGGNWFFLVENHGLDVSPRNRGELTRAAVAIREALEREGITGTEGAVIDHIEFFAPPLDPAHDSRNFVLCPGAAYDRSPCGTGTSAKLACLAADGKLEPGRVWRQEGISGGVFEAWYRREGGQIIPSIRGEAYITAISSLRFDETDPLRQGVRG